MMATRSTPKAPIFIRTPACTMLTPWGAANMADRRPGMQGPDAGQDPEPQKEQQKGELLCGRARKVPGAEARRIEKV